MLSEVCQGHEGARGAMRGRRVWGEGVIKKTLRCAGMGL